MPVWFHAPKDGLILLGGLLQFSSVTAAPTRFSVLTTKPNRLVARVHDRMPVIIDGGQLDEWLTGDVGSALAMLKPAAPAALVSTEVSTYVNAVKNEGPGCIAPRAPEAQGSLF